MSGGGERCAEVLGLIPAAGHATRMPRSPCSKEIYPIASGATPLAEPKAAGQFLLEKMAFAGIKQAYVVIREGKWDIPGYFRDGSNLDMHLSYVVIEPTAGPPYTLDKAYPFVRQSIVAFGFPDILFTGDDAYSRLLAAQSSGRADLVLGLFPADHPERMDMVEVADDGRVTDLVIQPRTTTLQCSWDAAVWRPAFTEFMHSHLAEHAHGGAPARELSMGHVIQAALRAGLRVEAVTVSDEPYCDIGTPEGLARALKRFARSD